MNEVIPGLWIGGWTDGRDAVGLRVVTVAVDSPFCGEAKFDLVDGPGNDMAEFERAVCHIALLCAEEPTLVHCIAGRSRSASICAVVVALRCGLSFYDALAKVRIARPEIDPAPALLEMGEYATARLRVKGGWEGQE